MEVSINAIIEVLNGVEDNLKKALHEQASYEVYQSHIDAALEKVQAAISELLRID